MFLQYAINKHGELVYIHQVARGKTDLLCPYCQKPLLARKLFGKLFGDKGYLSNALFEQLFSEHHLQLITRLRKNMKGKLVLLSDRLLLRRRAIIETINDQLKNISQIEHTRHRSPLNFLVNLVAGLIAYCWQPRKPSLGIIHHPNRLTT